MQSIEKHFSFIFFFSFIIFFIIPGPFQKVFRIFLGMYLCGLYFYIIFSGYANIFLPRWHFIYLLGNISLMTLVILKGHWQSVLINIFLFSFGVLLCSKKQFFLTKERITTLKILACVSIISMACQFVYSAFCDDFLSLLYEKNLSGVYILLFIVCMDIIKFRFAMIIGCLFSLFIVSRLISYSICIYFILKMLNLNKYIHLFPWIFIVLITLILFFFGNIFFLDNMDIQYSYQTDFSRLFEIRDGSNFLRFSTNVKLLEAMAPKDFDTNLYWGYGHQVFENFSDWSDNVSIVMPHNELLCSLAEHGIYYTVWHAFWISLLFNKLFSRTNCNMMLVALLVSLILWVKIIFIPSPEMLFLILLSAKNKTNKNSNVNSKLNPCVLQV